MQTSDHVTDEGGTEPYVRAHRGFDEWYLDARPRVIAAVSLWCGSVDAAADAADEAFVRALDRWHRVSAMASPTGWVITVALNIVRRRARRRALESALLRRVAPPAALPGPAGEVFDLLRELTPRQRTIVLLRYVADQPQADIATVLGVSRSTVSTALTSAHRRLRMLLDAPDPSTESGDRDD